MCWEKSINNGPYCTLREQCVKKDKTKELMNNKLKTALAEAISRASSIPLDVCLQALEKPKNLDFGDIAFPCFELAKSWCMAPAKCAEKLAASIELPSVVASIKIIGPFLNFHLERKSFAQKVLTRILGDKESLTAEAKTELRKALALPPGPILLDYSSPNIAKPFHVGHLRATLVGNSLDRLFRFIGFEVVSINHLGDWGTQFGFVWAGCQLWGKPNNASVNELVSLYRQATALKERQEKQELSPGDEVYPSVNDIARQYFSDLEAGKKEAVQFWRWCLDLSLAYFKAAYKRLGVHFDHYTGESFYSDKLADVRNWLEGAGILQESEGAFGVQLAEDLGFARIYTADGRSLYLARDIAAARYRAINFHFAKSIYVVGSQQNLHFRQLKGILASLGTPYADDIVHVAFGLVLGIKTRGQGKFIELNDFLDEAVDRALAAYRDQVAKRPEGLNEQEVAEAVSLAAVIYSTLGRLRQKDVVFNWDQALQFQGDSGPYLLYACTRINGIKDRARDLGIAPTISADFSLLKEESAHRLVLLLDEFPEILLRSARDYEPSYLASYALDLASALAGSYLELKVINAEKPLAEARLSLFEATRIVLEATLQLLGIRPLERM